MINPSDFYKKHWEATNIWLNGNAPDYVFKCITELSANYLKLIEEHIKLVKAIEYLTKIR